MVDYQPDVLYIHGMIYRTITSEILTAFSDRPVILLNGARQVGKSTLVEWLCEKKHPAQYFTLDDAAILSSVHANPYGFLTSFDGPIVLDEVQKAPELFPAIKRIVDKKRTPGKFLLTGSANVLLLPTVSESLAGRMEVITLWQFAQAELSGNSKSILDELFAGTMPSVSKKTLTRKSLVNIILKGGFPEVQTLKTSERRNAWFRSYVTTMIQRDIREISNIEGSVALPRLLSLLAARSGGLSNYAEIATSMGIPQTTLKRYIVLLQMTYFVYPLHAWSTNLSKRLIKSPKFFLTDTGLMAHLLGADDNSLFHDGGTFGRLLENFVLMELVKQSTWSKVKPSIFYLRTASGQEVDFILERADGKIVGIEVKSSATVLASDFSSLKMLAQETGKKFICGIILYTGSEVIPFGNKLFAVPVQLLME
jgi:predicted AAA+ superfamily ATPase